MRRAVSKNVPTPEETALAAVRAASVDELMADVLIDGPTIGDYTLEQAIAELRRRAAAGDPEAVKRVYF